MKAAAFTVTAPRCKTCPVPPRPALIHLQLLLLFPGLPTFRTFTLVALSLSLNPYKTPFELNRLKIIPPSVWWLVLRRVLGLEQVILMAQHFPACPNNNDSIRLGRVHGCQLSNSRQLLRAKQFSYGIRRNEMIAASWQRCQLPTLATSNI